MSGILAATLIGVLAAPTYEIVSSRYLPYEGQSLTVTLNQTNVPSGTTLYYELVAVSGGFNSSDLTVGNMSGTFVTNGSASQTFLTLEFENSYFTSAEGTEEFYVRLWNYPATTVLATTSSIFLLEDHSLSSASGQIVYGEPGTYSYVSPVTRTHCLLVIGGGGGGAAAGDAPGGGGGGGLAWVNSISLTGGTSYTVVVGSAGGGRWSASTTTPVAGPAGTQSYIISTTACRANGGTGGPATNGGRGTGGASAAAGGTARSIATGGQGGIGSTTDSDVDTLRESGPGGGAAGYNTGGVGGSGGATAAYNSSTAGTASSGCGAGGYCNTNFAGGGGGGVAAQGRGSNGVVTTSGDFAAGGGGGSGGGDGVYGWYIQGGDGGFYGGGGGACEYTDGWGESWGAPGAWGYARILWGSGRAYPTTNVADV